MEEAMSSSQRPSPRQEALNAILETRAIADEGSISEAAWDKLVTLAWDQRTYVGDRREIRREIRTILLDSGRSAGES
jgi:hypothetical protein